MKTIYKESAFSDDEMIQMAREASEDAVLSGNFYIEDYKWQGYAQNGLKFEGYHDGNEITTYYFCRDLP